MFVNLNYIIHFTTSESIPPKQHIESSKFKKKKKDMININKNKAISMMRGKSPPSELLRDNQVEQLFTILKNICKGKLFQFLSKYYFVIFFAFILIIRAKLSVISLFFSITLKFAIFTH